jgi:hypothetical protein
MRHNETQKEQEPGGVFCPLRPDLIADLATLALVENESLAVHIERVLDHYVNGRRPLLERYKKTQKEQGAAE